jgi:two-component system OmpR family response regulator
MYTAVAGSRVLVVDDDEHISELLATTLGLAGFTVAWALSGSEALRQVQRFRPWILVLDVMLPDLDGFEIVRRLREDGERMPVLFLTARDGIDDKLTGLTLGGDDYVTKPFSVAEVVVRVHALLRRARNGTLDPVLRFADLEMDEEAHEVRRAGRSVELSPTEYKLLRYLLVNARRVMSKGQILDHVWQYNFGGDSGVVEKFVSNLRRKIDIEDPPLIHTVRGFGYCLRLPRS